MDFEFEESIILKIKNKEELDKKEISYVERDYFHINDRSVFYRL